MVFGVARSDPLDELFGVQVPVVVVWAGVLAAQRRQAVALPDRLELLGQALEAANEVDLRLATGRVDLAVLGAEMRVRQRVGDLADRPR